ncbi:MAG: MmgE/PrpD family protein [Clostridiales bacterium]|nr:MmgE/PrpD family protein [Clostridiales bacterium]
MPPVLNAFGATAAVGKLLDLSESQMLDAISLTLCQATCSSELTNNSESPIRSVRDAFAAKIGVMSAQLAKRGIIGFKEPFEGSRGFYHAFARNDCDLTKLTEKLGEVYESGNISFKPWLSCRGTHPNIDGIRRILSQQHIEPEEIVNVHLVVSAVNAKLLCEPSEVKKKPQSPINAKFSLPFTVAIALIYGNVTLDHYNEKIIKDPNVLKLAEKVTYEIDPSMPKYKSLQSITTIHTKNQVFSQTVTEPLGSMDNPMTEEALVEKFLNCLKYSAKEYSEAESRELAEMILNIDSYRNVNDLIKYL